MRFISQLLSVLVLLISFPSVQGAEPAATFPLRDGDVWVMAGDSITAQHLHSNYFEAFCFARYPQLKFAFRNSGVGGHTIPTTLARFDYDVAAWKPTVISVELGMNDSGGTPTEKFMENMNTWLKRVNSVSARPILFSPSPVNDGTTSSNLPAGNRNIRLGEYSTALQKLATEEKLPYADQFHALFDRWGENKPQEQIANLVSTVRPLTGNQSIAGVEHLAEFVKAQDAQKVKPISLQGDAVHPGPCGQLMMAAALLKGLGADGFVSSAIVSADGKSVESTGCKITNVAVKDGTLTFERLDERLPFPIPEQAVSVLPLIPEVFELSKYTLQISGLPAGKYAVKIDGIEVALLTSEQLQQGVNLTAYAPELNPEPKNPVAVQGQAILKAVSDKEAGVGQWRSLSQRAHAAGAPSALMTELAALTERVNAADQKIRDTAKPRSLKFEIVESK